MSAFYLEKLVKFFKIVLVIIASLIATELIVRYLVGYPTYGVNEKVYGIRKTEPNYENIYKAYSKFWKLEGGYEVFKRNNLGLPGIDINVNKTSKYVFILGDSYVEAVQTRQDSIATSLFQYKLNNISGEIFQVLNLGVMKYDPIDLYFRSEYFASILAEPSFVILIISPLTMQWINRHKFPIVFNMPENFGKPKKDFLFILQRFMRNNSSMINLLALGFKAIETESTNDVSEPNDLNYNILDNKDHFDESIKILFETLKEYKLRYKEKFMLISISDNNKLNSILVDFAKSNTINFFYKDLDKKEYQLVGKHFNIKGNEELSKLLFESFITLYNRLNY